MSENDQSTEGLEDSGDKTRPSFDGQIVARAPKEGRSQPVRGFRGADVLREKSRKIGGRVRGWLL